MRVINSMKIELPSKASNLKVACSAVMAFANDVTQDKYVLDYINTGVSEAVDNSIKFAYPNQVGVIAIRCRLLEDNTLEVVVKDKGIGIDDIEQAMVPLYTTGDKKEHSGMGFTIMESFMDDLRVKSILGKGTTVRMRKKIK